MIEGTRARTLFGEDAFLVELLRGLPDVGSAVREGAPRAFERAREHGLAGVLFDAWSASSHPLPEPLANELRMRAVARELDAAATWAILERIDEAFAAHSIAAVLLKGHAFARRFYGNPAARHATDIDVLVTPETLEAATEALGTVGYHVAPIDKNAVALDEHHHWLLGHEHAAALELHFHAYRGFGELIPGTPLLERSTSLGDKRALRILDVSDELVFLVVHVAGHRFERISWLYDVNLLLATMSASEIDVARARAADWGFRRVFSYGLDIVRDAFGERPARAHLLDFVVREPRQPLLRAGTRFLYTTALADSFGAAARYAKKSSFGHVRDLWS